jgi:hypothetical protein
MAFVPNSNLKRDAKEGMPLFRNGPAISKTLERDAILLNRKRL